MVISTIVQEIYKHQVVNFLVYSGSQEKEHKQRKTKQRKQKEELIKYQKNIKETIF